MADEVLSQAEVENLLSAMAAHTARGGGTADIEAPVLAGARAGARVREKVIPYDFKRPERVGKDQMRALQSLHEGFGRNFSAALSALLRSIVEVKLTSVDQLTYGEFVFSLENPTCFNLLRAEPLEGNLILDIDDIYLKTKYFDIFLIVIIIDANNQLFSMIFRIVDIENNQN